MMYEFIKQQKSGVAKAKAYILSLYCRTLLKILFSEIAEVFYKHCDFISSQIVDNAKYGGVYYQLSRKQVTGQITIRTRRLDL